MGWWQTPYMCSLVLQLDWLLACFGILRIQKSAEGFASILTMPASMVFPPNVCPLMGFEYHCQGTSRQFLSECFFVWQTFCLAIKIWMYIGSESTVGWERFMTKPRLSVASIILHPFMHKIGKHLHASLVDFQCHQLVTRNYMHACVNLILWVQENKSDSCIHDTVIHHFCGQLVLLFEPVFNFESNI